MEKKYRDIAGLERFEYLKHAHSSSGLRVEWILFTQRIRARIDKILIERWFGYMQQKNRLDEFNGGPLPAAPLQIIKLVILWRLYCNHPRIHNIYYRISLWWERLRND